MASAIDVWYVSLKQPVSRFWKTLSPDERTRAEQYYASEDRDRFVIRRGVLRTLLGRYLSIEPKQVKFYYGKNGKPGVIAPPGKAGIHFNLSHSEDFALYVFSRDNNIGVDVECLQDIPEMEQITELYFTPGEKSIFRGLPASKKKREFYRYWTRKEAIVKAMGGGLSLPLDTLDVSPASTDSSGLHWIESDMMAVSRWSVRDLNPAPGFYAAFAAEGPIGPVNSGQWSG